MTEVVSHYVGAEKELESSSRAASPFIYGCLSFLFLSLFNCLYGIILCLNIGLFPLEE